MMKQLPLYVRYEDCYSLAKGVMKDEEGLEKPLS